MCYQLSLLSPTSAYDDGPDTLVVVVACLNNMRATEQNVARMLLDVKCHVSCGDKTHVVGGNRTMFCNRRLCHWHTFTW